MMREDRNIIDLFTANYTFVNERLAKHYGIPNIYGGQFRRVTFGPETGLSPRTARPGEFPVGDMAAEFPNLTRQARRVGSGKHSRHSPSGASGECSSTGRQRRRIPEVMTLREQMTLHRKNEPCASCHKIMDPIGFALENFDADAKWRTKQGGEGGVPIDTAVELWDGTKVNGPAGLRQALLRYSPQFVRMMTEKMMTYALGAASNTTICP